MQGAHTGLWSSKSSPCAPDPDAVGCIQIKQTTLRTWPAVGDEASRQPGRSTGGPGPLSWTLGDAGGRDGLAFRHREASAPCFERRGLLRTRRVVIGGVSLTSRVSSDVCRWVDCIQSWPWGDNRWSSRRAGPSEPSRPRGRTPLGQNFTVTRETSWDTAGSQPSR